MHTHTHTISKKHTYSYIISKDIQKTFCIIKYEKCKQIYLSLYVLHRFMFFSILNIWNKIYLIYTCYYILYSLYYYTHRNDVSQCIINDIFLFVFVCIFMYVHMCLLLMYIYIFVLSTYTKILNINMQSSI